MNNKITKKNDGVPYVASQVIFRFGTRNLKEKALREYPVTNDT